MDKRFFLALLLTAIVIIVPPMFFNTGTRSPARVCSRQPGRGEPNDAVACHHSTGIHDSTGTHDGTRVRAGRDYDGSDAPVAIRLQLAGGRAYLGCPRQLSLAPPDE